MIDKYILAERASAIGDGIIKIENFTDAIISTDAIVEYSEKNTSALLESALESDFNSKKELDAKKVMAAAMIIAKSKGILPVDILENNGVFDAASIADEAISRMKVAYQISKGYIDVYEGADKLIDQATARALAVSDRVVEIGVDFAINKVAIAVARCYPPALPVVTVLKNYQPFITKKSQELVNSGMGKLNKAAKSLVHKAGELIKNKISSKVRLKIFS